MFCHRCLSHKILSIHSRYRFNSPHSSRLRSPLAFVSCLVALLASRWGIVTSKVAATVGAVSALSATIHVSIINVDLHTWFEESMQFPLRDNPFAGFAQQLGKVLASKIQIIPGVGLYVLAVALALVALAYHSRLLARLRLDK